MKDKELQITITRSEQWEWAAMGYGQVGRGSSPEMAELDLLRKILKMKLED